MRHTYRRSKRQIIVLVSRCSGPVLRTVNGRRLKRGCHSALGNFCSILGAVSKCVHFTLLAKIAGFNGMDIFDSLGGLGSVSVSRPCIRLYKVARGRVRRCLRPRVHRLTGCRGVSCRSTYQRLGRQCSNCRFARGSVNLCGPFDVLGAFCGVGFNDC